ncbi:MAG: arylamine N-acetyltransferase [Thermomicrobiales bacterium]
MAQRTVADDIAGSTGSTSEWGIEQLDLDAYLRRLDYTGNLDPTVATLQALHQAHTASIPFENLDILLGRGISCSCLTSRRSSSGIIGEATASSRISCSEQPSNDSASR